MTPQQKALQDCIDSMEKLLSAVKIDRHDTEDWPKDSRESLEQVKIALTQAKQALDHVPDAGKMVQAQGEACEVLATVLHFIPASETDLLRDVSALGHDLRTHGKPQAQGEAIPHSGADENPPVFGRRWKIAADGFGLQRDDLNGRYVDIDDALSVLHSAHPQASEPLSSELVPLSSEPQEADPNAPWLTKAHMLCTDHGVPQGNIEWRIEVLRGLFSNPQASEPVGINGLTQAETDASMSVRGLSNPTASEPAEKRTLYECTGCGHLHNERVSSCDCRENPGNTYNLWTAAPEATASEPEANSYDLAVRADNGGQP